MDLQADTRLKTNNDRVREREWLIPLLRERLRHHSRSELASIFEREGLPVAPITAPHELLEDPHLLATGGLDPMNWPDGKRADQTASTALLPLTLDGARLGVRHAPPPLGQESMAVLTELGYDSATALQLSMPHSSKKQP